MNNYSQISNTEYDSDIEDFKQAANGMGPTDLINFAVSLDEEKKVLIKQSAYINWLIVQHMEAEEATKIVTSITQVELEYRVEYDQEWLLFELGKDELLLDRMVTERMFTPEHEVTTKVAGKFNMTRLKPLVKEGKKYRDILEGAKRLLPNPKIKLTRL